MRLDVGDKLVELGALHQREDVGERVKLELDVHGVGSPARSSIRSSARTGTRNSLPILTTGTFSRCRNESGKYTLSGRFWSASIATTPVLAMRWRRSRGVATQTQPQKVYPRVSIRQLFGLKMLEITKAYK